MNKEVPRNTTREDYNPFKGLLLLIRKVRLMRRIGRRNRRAKKQQALETERRKKFLAQCRRRRRRRIIRLFLRSCMKSVFRTNAKIRPVELVLPVVSQGITYTKWGRRRRIFGFLWRRFLQSLLKGERREKKPGKKYTLDTGSKLAILMNSTAGFLMAYFTIQFVGMWLTTLFAGGFDYDSAIRYWGVIYYMTPREWTPDAVLTLYSIMPFTGLIMGLLGLIVYHYVQHFEGILKIFFLWLYVCGLIAFFGALSVGTIFTKGFGHVIVYLYFMDTAKLIFSLVSLGVLLLSGTFSRTLFLNSANSYFPELNHLNLRPFIRYQVILPLVAGSIFILMVKIPELTYYEAFTFVPFLIFLLPLWMSPGLTAELQFESTGTIRLRKWLFILSIVVWAVFRMLATPGLRG